MNEHKNHVLFAKFDYLSLHFNLFHEQGTKWITNKWIRQNAQFKHYPCPTQFNYKLKRQDSFNNPWIQKCMSDLYINTGDKKSYTRADENNKKS